MRIACLSLLILAVPSSFSIAQAPSVPKIEVTADYLRKELPKFLIELEERFSQLSGKCAILETLDYDKVPEATKEKWKFASDSVIPTGEQTIGKFMVSFALTKEYQKSEITSDFDGVIDSVAGKERQKPPYKNAFCIGPRGCFTLLWKSKDSAVDVTSFSLTGEKEKPRIQTNFLYALHATYSIPLMKRLSSLLTDDHFSISEVGHVNLDGNDCIRAAFVFKQPYTRRVDKKAKTSDIEIRGNFVVDPSFSWALRSWEYSTPEISRSNAMRIQYSRTADGAFLPSEVISTNDNSRTRVCRFEELSVVPVDDKQFTLTYFGLPELDRPIGEITNNSMAIWLGTGAILTLGIATFLWFKSRQNRS
jgi:hypothetical protein